MIKHVFFNIIYFSVILGLYFAYYNLLYIILYVKGFVWLLTKMNLCMHVKEWWMGTVSEGERVLIQWIMILTRCET